jgi:hypothetical protein
VLIRWCLPITFVVVVVVVVVVVSVSVSVSVGAGVSVGVVVVSILRAPPHMQFALTMLQVPLRRSCRRGLLLTVAVIVSNQYLKYCTAT